MSKEIIAQLVAWHSTLCSTAPNIGHGRLAGFYDQVEAYTHVRGPINFKTLSLLPENVLDYWWRVFKGIVNE